MMQNYHGANQAQVKLDDYICDLNLEIEDGGYSCTPMSKDGFSFMWAGAKATYGIRSGKACFEVKVADYSEATNKDPTDTYVARVGWSTDSATLQLGEDKNSFGFGGTGKKSVNRKFLNYGRRYEKGDVVGCYLSMDNGWVDISYSVNGRYCGSAFKIRWMTDEALFPHVLSKNCKLEVNFGQAPHPYFSLQPSYKLIDHFPSEFKILAVRPPPSQRDCEVIMMVGLPGVGKSTWAMNYAKIHPSKKYVVLGTDSIIDKMRIMGLPRKNNFSGRWEVLIKQASDCFNVLLRKASNLPRNLILDQTNVYATARRRKVKQYREKGYTVNAMVLVPRDEDMVRRSQRRTIEEGKEVPEAAVLDMKANFSLPDEREQLFDQITFLELQRPEAQALVEQYNRDAMAKGHRSNQQRGNVSGNLNQVQRSQQERGLLQGSPASQDRYGGQDRVHNQQWASGDGMRSGVKRADSQTPGPPEKYRRSEPEDFGRNSAQGYSDGNRYSPYRPDWHDSRSQEPQTHASQHGQRLNSQGPMPAVDTKPPQPTTADRSYYSATNPQQYGLPGESSQDDSWNTRSSSYYNDKKDFQEPVSGVVKTEPVYRGPYSGADHQTYDQRQRTAADRKPNQSLDSYSQAPGPAQHMNQLGYPSQYDPGMQDSQMRGSTAQRSFSEQSHMERHDLRQTGLGSNELYGQDRARQREAPMHNSNRPSMSQFEDQWGKQHQQSGRPPVAQGNQEQSSYQGWQEPPRPSQNRSGFGQGSSDNSYGQQYDANVNYGARAQQIVKQERLPEGGSGSYFGGNQMQDVKHERNAEQGFGNWDGYGGRNTYGSQGAERPTSRDMPLQDVKPSAHGGPYDRQATADHHRRDLPDQKPPTDMYERRGAPPYTGTLLRAEHEVQDMDLDTDFVDEITLPRPGMKRGGDATLNQQSNNDRYHPQQFDLQDDDQKQLQYFDQQHGRSEPFHRDPEHPFPARSGRNAPRMEPRRDEPTHEREPGRLRGSRFEEKRQGHDSHADQRRDQPRMGERRDARSNRDDSRSWREERHDSRSRKDESWDREASHSRSDSRSRRDEPRSRRSDRDEPRQSSSSRSKRDDARSQREPHSKDSSHSRREDNRFSSERRSTEKATSTGIGLLAEPSALNRREDGFSEKDHRSPGSRVPLLSKPEGGKTSSQPPLRDERSALLPKPLASRLIQGDGLRGTGDIKPTPPRPRGTVAPDGSPLVRPETPKRESDRMVGSHSKRFGKDLSTADSSLGPRGRPLIPEKPPRLPRPAVPDPFDVKTKGLLPLPTRQQRHFDPPISQEARDVHDPLGETDSNTLSKLASVDFDKLKASLAKIRRDENLLDEPVDDYSNEQWPEDYHGLHEKFPVPEARLRPPMRPRLRPRGPLLRRPGHGLIRGARPMMRPPRHDVLEAELEAFERPQRRALLETPITEELAQELMLEEQLVNVFDAQEPLLNNGGFPRPRVRLSRPGYRGSRPGVPLRPRLPPAGGPESGFRMRGPLSRGARFGGRMPPRGPLLRVPRPHLGPRYGNF